MHVYYFDFVEKILPLRVTEIEALAAHVRSEVGVLGEEEQRALREAFDRLCADGLVAYVKVRNACVRTYVLGILGARGVDIRLLYVSRCVVRVILQLESDGLRFTDEAARNHVGRTSEEIIIKSGGDMEVLKALAGDDKVVLDVARRAFDEAKALDSSFPGWDKRRR